MPDTPGRDTHAAKRKPVPKKTKPPKKTAAQKRADERAKNFAAATSIFVPAALQHAPVIDRPRDTPGRDVHRPPFRPKPKGETAEQKRIREKSQRVARERYQLGLKYGATGENDLRAVPTGGAAQTRRDIIADRNLSPFEKRRAIAKLTARTRTAGPSPIAIGKALGLGVAGLGQDLYGWGEDRARDLAELPGEILYGDTNPRSPIPESVQRIGAAGAKLPGSKEFVRTTTMTPEEQERVAEEIFGKTLVNLFAHGDTPRGWGEVAGLGVGVAGILPVGKVGKLAGLAAKAGKSIRAGEAVTDVDPLIARAVAENAGLANLDEALPAPRLTSKRVDKIAEKAYSDYKAAHPQGKLTPEEAKSIVRRMHGYAARGRAGALWYEKSSARALMATGGDVEEATRIMRTVAYLSAANGVKANVGTAIRAWQEFKETGVVTRVGRYPQRQTPKVQEILEGGDWGGRKSNNFERNFVEDVNPELFAQKYPDDPGFVTVDRWIKEIVNEGSRDKGVGDAEYTFAQNAIRHLTEGYKWGRPKRTQAAMWVSIKADTEGTQIADIAGDDVSAFLESTEYVGRTNLEGATDEWAGYANLAPDQQEAYTEGQTILVRDALRKAGFAVMKGESGVGVWGDERNAAGGLNVLVGATRIPKNPADPEKVLKVSADEVLVDAKVFIGGDPEDAASYSKLVTDSERQAMDSASSFAALHTGQAAGAWVRPIPINNRGYDGAHTTLGHFDVGRRLTGDEMGAVTRAVSRADVALGGDGTNLVVVHADGGFMVFDGDEGRWLHKVTNGSDKRGSTFKKAVTKELGAEDLDLDAEATWFAHAGGYNEADAYQGIIDESGRAGALRDQGPDLHAAVQALRLRFDEDPEGAIAVLRRLASEETGTLNLGGFFRRAGKTAEKAPPVQGPKTLQETVVEAIPTSKPVYAEQAALRSEERAKRLKEALPALERGGVQGRIEARQALQGELPKLEWEGFQFLDETSREALERSAATNPDLKGWEVVRVVWAIDRAMSKGTITPSEVKVLEKAFGAKVAENLGDPENMTLIRWLYNLGIDLWNVPRSLMASYDLSAPFRQGLMSGAGHPILFARNLKPMVKSFGREQTYLAHMDEIAGRENFHRYEKAKLAMTDIFGSGSGREEAFPPSLAERTPGVKIGVKASSRAYSLFLTKQRVDVFDYLLEGAAKRGQDIDDPKFLKALGRMINNTTGRGKIPTKYGEDAAQFLNNFFFSPRLLASRFQVFNPEYYWTLYRSGPAGPFLARQAVKDAALTIGEITAAATLLSRVPGVDVGTNPTSADFGKVRIGDTRIDLAGGFQPMIVLFERIRRGETTASSTGITRKLGGYGGANRWELVQRFLEGKMAPTPGIIRDLASDQKTFIGEPLTLGGVAKENLIPLNFQAAYDALKEDGYSVAAISAILGSIGFGTTSYPDAAPGESGGGSASAGGSSEMPEPGEGGGGGYEMPEPDEEGGGGYEMPEPG